MTLLHESDDMYFHRSEQNELVNTHESFKMKNLPLIVPTPSHATELKVPSIYRMLGVRRRKLLHSLQRLFFDREWWGHRKFARHE